MGYDVGVICMAAQEMGVAVFSPNEIVEVEVLALSIIVRCSAHSIESVHQIPRCVLDSDDPVKTAQIYRVETAMFQAEKEASIAMMKQMSLDAWRKELKAQYGQFSA